jgi:ATPase subunit of ABC transporter with duplicated ATPase domains
MMLEEHNFIILDEPNNHLDLEAVSALGWALQEYKGTVLTVSHDRDLIGHFATKIIAFEENGIRLFDGPLEEYLSIRQKK